MRRIQSLTHTSNHQKPKQKPHTTRNVKYDEAVLAAKQIYEKVIGINRMMNYETIPFYKIQLVKELKKLSADYLKQNRIIEQTKTDQKLINEIGKLQASLFKIN
jgi:hypothetical protein